MNTISCPMCGYENKYKNVRCKSCGAELDSVKPNDVKTSNGNHIIINTILIFMLIPWLFAGIVFFGAGAYNIIGNNNKAKNYLKTEGELVRYTNCHNDDDGDEICNALYKYEVNGHTYEGSPKLLSTRDGFKQTIIVKYNPDNPNEYVMNSNWNSIVITGMIVFIATIFIFKISSSFIKDVINTRSYKQKN